jgi:hypothetical protein
MIVDGTQGIFNDEVLGSAPVGARLDKRDAAFEAKSGFAADAATPATVLVRRS